MKKKTIRLLRRLIIDLDELIDDDGASTTDLHLKINEILELLARFK